MITDQVLFVKAGIDHRGVTSSIDLMFGLINNDSDVDLQDLVKIMIGCSLID